MPAGNDAGDHAGLWYIQHEFVTSSPLVYAHPLEITPQWSQRVATTQCISCSALFHGFVDSDYNNPMRLAAHGGKNRFEA
jgi:hypothetical protein